MNANVATPRRSKRRYLRFSLRTLMLFITLGCIWLGFVNARVNRQRRAVAAIEKLNGIFGYDDETNAEGQIDHSIPPVVPRCLTNAIGRDYFANVVFVELEGNLSDRDFDGILTLDKLKIVCLGDGGEQFTMQADLTRLKELPNLKRLILRSYQFPEGYVERLRAVLPNVEIETWEGRMVAS